jgi:hypothetical protein
VAVRAADRALASHGFLLVVTMCFVLVVSAPTIVAAAGTPEGHRFTGLVTHPYDQTYYLASERGAAVGSSRANRFTSEPDAPGPISPLYPALGRIERGTGLPPGSLFHLPQILVALTLPAAVWWFAGLVHGRDGPARRWSLVLALFGAGLAAISRGPLGSRSADGAVTELTPVLSVAVMPHFAVAYLGLVLVWGAVVLALSRGLAVGSLAAAAIGGLLLSLSHGFLLLPVGIGCALLAGALLVRRLLPSAVHLGVVVGVAGLVAAPFLVSLAAEQRRFERLQGHPFPSRPSDAAWTWLLGEPVLALLLLGTVAWWGARRTVPGIGLWVPVAWLVAQGALVFLPVTVFQRRFSEGIVIPAAAIAGAGTARLAGSWTRSSKAALAGIVVASSLSLALLAGRRSLDVPADTDRAMSALHEDDVVLAGFDLSWQLPALSTATSYLGRSVETLHYEEKHAAAVAFLHDPRAEDSRRWLEGSGITAILVDRTDPSLPAPAAESCFSVTTYGPALRLLRPSSTCFGAG